MSIWIILRCIRSAKLVKIVLTFEKVIKTFLFMLLLSLRKSNQNASAVLKKLKNRTKSYFDLNSGKRSASSS